MSVTLFQAPISPADRQRTWGWDPQWGDQPSDQHLRDWLMLQDNLVLDQLAAIYEGNCIENTGGWEQF